MPDSTAQPLPARLEISLTMAGQLRPVGVLALVLVAYPVLWAVGVIPGWLAVAGVLVFGAIITFGLVTAVRSRRRGWVLRLEPSGITVRDRGRVPWSVLDEVLVTGLQPSWFFLLGRGRYPVLAFIPRPGVQLPALQLPGGPGQSDRLGAVRERLYGTRLVLMPHAMSASVNEVVTAARDWGQVPVDFSPALRRR